MYWFDGRGQKRLGRVTGSGERVKKSFARLHPCGLFASRATLNGQRAWGILARPLLVLLTTKYLAARGRLMPEGSNQTEEVREAERSEDDGRARVEEVRRALPLVAVVGRPNVGKSTLFNRLTGERRSIVGDEPGITRDRIYGEAEWNGRRFALVDTGGIVPDDTEVIPAHIFRQAEFAITEAAALLWVVDARAGVPPLDEELVRLLRPKASR